MKRMMIIFLAFLVVGCAARNQMITAAKSGDISQIQQLKSKGTNINEQDYMYRTPLIIAIINGKRDAALALIKAGAKTDIIDYSGLDAMAWAIVKNDKDIIDALVSAGEKPRPREGKAGIFFLRDAKYPFYGAPAFIDGQEVFVLSSKGAFYYTEVDAGKHEVASLSRGSGWKRMMELDAGKTYYILLGPRTESIAATMVAGAVGYFAEGYINNDSSGPWMLTAINEAAARKTINEIVLTE